MSQTRSLGVTVMPEYLQTEGVEQVLDTLQARAGVTGVATSPYVMEPADEASGGREPPADAGAGGVRLLDRPLWGHRALFVRTAPSFTPDARLYAGLRYQPVAPDELSEREGPVVAAFIRAARTRGLEVHLQVQAAIPPGYRVQFGGAEADDQPRMANGKTMDSRVDKNASLASPHIRDYGCALIRDLVRAYPEIDGLRIDWPEYPPYAFNSLFFDFGGHVEAAAVRLGLDFARMRAHTQQLYDYLADRLTDGDLARWLEPDGGRYRLLRLLGAYPGVADLLHFKAALVVELLSAYRAALSDAGGAEKQLIPQAFPPPWSVVSGFDFARAAAHSDAIGVKLCTMHWPMMLSFYAHAILALRPDLSRDLLRRALLRLLDIADDAGLAELADYRYPEPDEPHPVGPGAQARKIAAAQAEAGAMPIVAFTHGYGPLDDDRQRMATGFQAAGGRMVVNRYGYLSDRKLDILGEATGFRA